ncbi:MAG: hypothetical protein HY791_39660 [Deltaproteobacteria bacterium]|nr:hypothetical protein [Deltaproteobacteria bacterium]
MKRLLLAPLLSLACFACRDSPPTTGDKPKADTGTTGPTLCSTTTDCGGLGICVAGVCEAVTPCSADSECQNAVCHTTRGYCVQCDGRHPNECQAGQTCQYDFTCVAIGGPDAGPGDGGTCSGTCATKAECGGEQVCKNGACCAPPPRCFTADDCPANSPECNGADGRCFGSMTCATDNECLGFPGCSAGGCYCDSPPTGVCRVRENECAIDADCQDTTKVCTPSTPRRCVTAQTCTNDTQCQAEGLICDQASGRCKNGQPCPNGNECTPGTQACVGGVCVPRTCLNDPTLCATGQVCNASGQCVTSADTCTSDAQCSSGYYCDTTASRCAVGCRSSTDCGGGTCDAAHRCQGQGTVCGDCMTDAECPAGSACTQGKCRQQCAAPEECSPLPFCGLITHSCLCL